MFKTILPGLRVPILSVGPLMGYIFLLLIPDRFEGTKFETAPTV
jgi:hypothetical protein